MTAAFPGRELDHGSPRNPPVREPRNRVVQVQRLRRSRRAGGGRRSPAESGVGRGASSHARPGSGVHRRGDPAPPRRRPPFVLGYDVVGEIDQLGDGVSGFQLGDRVADLTVLGSNAAYCTLRADRLTRVPAGVDAAEAAALILSWTTAYQPLHRAARARARCRRRR